MSPQQEPKRDRGRVLTDAGKDKIRRAIREWEVQTETRCTQEKLRELAGLDPSTSSKILNCRGGADQSKIDQLFRAFGLRLDEADHKSAAQVNFSEPDPNFVGREGAIAHLNNLSSQGARVILIQAKGGVGKTTLARKYLKQEFSSFLEFPIAKETKDIASVESLIEERLRQLNEEPGGEFLVSLDRLKRKLQTERIGVLIDNLEPALDGDGKFIEPHRSYVELLRILGDPAVQSVTLIASRECLRESAVTVRHYSLEGLDLAAWQQFFKNRNIRTDSSVLSTLHQAYGGNAKAMEILRGAVYEDFADSLEAYWQANQGDWLVEKDLEDLVASQFNRLQQLDADAYRLLCRLGCYRYQDVPYIPIEGLFCLLWDVPEAQRRRVVNSLRDRSLVEFHNGEYWLHPVIRVEAVNRLRTSECWETANHTVAEFWTESVKTVETTEDALKAFEAYHHYVEVNDFETASVVLVNERENRWTKFAPLAVSFYRLGLLKQIISPIILIIKKISFGYPLSRLHNVLGNLYLIIGNIHEAIKCFKESGRVAIEVQKSLLPGNHKVEIKLRLRRCEVASILEIALCEFGLWEIEKAIELFQQVNSFPETNDFAREPAIVSLFCLAYLNSELNIEEQAKHFAKKSEEINPEFMDSYHIEWAIGHRLLFLGLTHKNLGNSDKSFEMFHRAILFAEESHYTQVKAKSLSGLAELYRNQEEFKTALSNHSEAIELLEKIGAKCDLAEAYYQLGLTYQKMGEVEKSGANFQKAIRLFSEMEAPKQVEKVQRAIEKEDNRQPEVI